MLLAPLLTGCGKFTDKFSRINGDVTRVYFDSRNDQMHNAAVLNGGLMIYFMDASNHDAGKAFGFSSEDLVNSKSVLLANGQYKVYAYGWSGSNKLEGQVRCGYGDGGNVITLSGAATTVSISLNQGNCAFGSASPFGTASGGNASSATNFKLLTTRFCSGEAYPNCSDSSSGTFWMKAELLAGYGSGGVNDFTETPEFNVASGCSSASSSNAFLSSSFVIPLGGSNYFSPPVRLSFYPDSSCTSASGTYLFNDGLSKFLSVSSGSSYYLDMVSSSNSYFILQLNRYF